MSTIGAKKKKGKKNPLLKDNVVTQRASGFVGDDFNVAADNKDSEPKNADLYTQLTPHPTVSRWFNSISGSELTWTQLQAIMRNAELGYTEQWGDLTRRMLKSDDHLQSVYTTYIGPISQARREVKPKNLSTIPKHLRVIAETQAFLCEELLNSLPNIERSFAQLLDGDFTGYAVLEIKWGVKDEMIYPERLIWLHPSRFRFSSNFELYLWDRGAGAERAQELGMELNMGDTGVFGLPLTPGRYVIHIPQLIPDYPTSSGILLDCVRPWYAKMWAERFNLSGAEYAGNPRLLGHLPDQASPANVRDELYNALDSLSADSFGIVSGQTSIEVLDVKAEGEGGVWDTIIKRANAAFSKAILGSTLNVEIGDTGGNRAAAESQADTTIGPRWTRSAQLLANTIETYLFKPFLEHNSMLFDGHVFVPQLELHITEDEPAVDADIIEAGLLTVDEFRRSRKLAPLGPERDGDMLLTEWRKKQEQLAAIGPTGPDGEPLNPEGVQDPANPAAAPEPPKPLEITVGSKWTDSVDGNTLEVTRMDTRVYFRDLDADNPQAQSAWSIPYFLERCNPLAVDEEGSAVGGAEAQGDGEKKDSQGDVEHLLDEGLDHNGNTNNDNSSKEE